MRLFRKLDRIAALVAIALLGCVAAASAEEPAASLSSETPANFIPKYDKFDYVKREEMIPMRDGVNLKTFLLVPKGAKEAPVLLSRTTCNASERVLRFNSPHLAAVVPQMDDTAVAAGYIIVYQDVRGPDLRATSKPRNASGMRRRARPLSSFR